MEFRGGSRKKPEWFPTLFIREEEHAGQYNGIVINLLFSRLKINQ